MNIQELRIGNKLFLPHLDVVAVVLEIRFKYVRCAFQRKDIDEPHVSLIDINECEPIKLTEEWLLKAGAEKINSENQYADTNDYILGILYFNIANQSTKINGKYALSFIPDYVHELQNLFFALTGEELTFNN